jgi:hypothetical protein
MTDPRRWRSDPSRVAAADLVLRAARRPRLPGPDDLARLSTFVCDLPRRATLRKRRVARVIAGVVGLALPALLATSVWAWRRAEDGSRSVSLGQPACTQESPSREIARSLGRPTLVVSPRTIGRKLARQPRHNAPVQRTRAEPPQAPQESPDPLTRETELITAARSEIAAAPDAALARLDDHRRECPDGQLAPEREFLAVDALRRLNRIREARERALDLTKRFPASSYGMRATQLLDIGR